MLSDFEEFSTYDCRFKPTANDPVSNARTLYIPFAEYLDRWEEIDGIFSREAVLRGSFDKYVEDNKRKRGTAEVDTVFLSEIERWHELLAKNIVLRNPSLAIRDLNYTVQKIIDRIIFLRICEDRGTEDCGRLDKVASEKNAYPNLLKRFQEADDCYNSGLFHFSDEKSQSSAPDKLTPTLTIDDQPLRDIINNLYYPKSPCAFSVIPPDILGHVYEQFLGKTIAITVDKRKAGGVYYTPTYIVDYIVENTLGRLLNGDDPNHLKPIAVSRAAELKVLDPACGSGSFLIVAYQYLLDWHRDQYILDHDAVPDAATGLYPLDKNKIKLHGGGKNPKIFQAGEDECRLTIAERKRILLNNVHGVDIDSQAVEVTKLSLLLKVLEGETDQVSQRDFIKERERILPDLGQNILCGNSLIGPDFYAQPDLPELDDQTRMRINIFDWNAAYPEVFKNGGFDCVVGNPPWGASISDSAAKYLSNQYRRVVDRMVDTYVYFIDKPLRILVQNGKHGLVMPSTILNQSDTLSVRKLLASTGIDQLINLGQGVFGKGAKNTTTLLLGSNGEQTKAPYFPDLQSTRIEEKKEKLGSESEFRFKDWIELANADANFTVFISDVGGAQLLSKLRTKFDAFNRVVAGKIQRGVTPDCAEMHVVSDDSSLRSSSDILRRSLSGRVIKRFQTPQSNQSLIYTTRNTPISEHPEILNWMAPLINAAPKSQRGIELCKPFLTDHSNGRLADQQLLCT